MTSADAYKARIKSCVEVAESYTKRKPGRHAAEMRLIERGLGCVGSAARTFLDAPCGVGRATILLAQKGYATTGCDLGDGAVEVARREVEQAGVSAIVEKGDLEDLAYNDQSFDAVLCFRLLHHFPNAQIRAKVISELCRVARRHVLISYLNPFSATCIRRKLLKKRYAKRSQQYATSLSEVKSYFAPHGYQLVKDFAQMRLFHSLHLAVFEKQST